VNKGRRNRRPAFSQSANRHFGPTRAAFNTCERLQKQFQSDWTRNRPMIFWRWLLIEAGRKLPGRVNYRRGTLLRAIECFIPTLLALFTVAANCTPRRRLLFPHTSP
jgi:hypothetical protein